MFNESFYLFIVMLILFLIKLIQNKLNVCNLVYGIFINVLLFTNLLLLLNSNLQTIIIINFFFFLISFDLLIWYIYIYNKFNLISIKSI